MSQKKKLKKQHRKEVRAAREIGYPKCPVCTSKNIRVVSKSKVECATCHTSFNVK